MIERWVKIQIIAPKASNVESCLIIIGDEQKTSHRPGSLKSNLFSNNSIFLVGIPFPFFGFHWFYSIPCRLTLSRYTKNLKFRKISHDRDASQKKNVETFSEVRYIFCDGHK